MPRRATKPGSERRQSSRNCSCPRSGSVQPGKAGVHDFSRRSRGDPKRAARSLHRIWTGAKPWAGFPAAVPSYLRLLDSLPDRDSDAGGHGGSTKWLLVVDDDELMVRALAHYFRKRGFEVADAGTVAGAEAAYARRARWSLVIADYQLPDGNGWDLFCWIRQQPGTPPPLLLISGAVGASTLHDRVEFLAKPFSMGELSNRVGALLGDTLD